MVTQQQAPEARGQGGVRLIWHPHSSVPGVSWAASGRLGWPPCPAHPHLARGTSADTLSARAKFILKKCNEREGEQIWQIPS